MGDHPTLDPHAPQPNMQVISKLSSVQAARVGADSQLRHQGAAIRPGNEDVPCSLGTTDLCTC